MITLGALLRDTQQEISPSLLEVKVEHLALSSRDVRPGSLFFALPGTIADGRDYIDAALEAGAVAVLAEAQGKPDSIPDSWQCQVLWVENLAELVGPVAAEFYHRPSRSLQIVGVTGTNGKTSVTQLIAQMINGLIGSASCAVIGTMGVGIPGQPFAPSMNTTADAITNQARLAELAERGTKYVAMEVSSHALEQERVRGIDFAVAVFTNLSRDHLDYHGSMDRYARAKARLLFDYGSPSAVINQDDAWGRQWLRVQSAAHSVSYGLSRSATVHATEMRSTSRGQAFLLRTPEGHFTVNTSLIGRFNVYNLLAAGAAVRELGFTWQQIVEQMAVVEPVPGRMERLGGAGAPTIVIDYAHTPDALENALGALREHAPAGLWCVFGCGGDRDPGKRPMMAKVAERLADRVVVTDDNPRFEDGNQIVTDILEGFDHPERVVVERNRAAAIRWVIANARPDDVVLIAGKGHENYQTVKGRNLPHNDRDCVAKALAEAASCG